MGWGTEYVPERATVTISGSGGLHPGDVQRVTEEAVHLLREKKSSRLLVDCSQGFLDLRLVDVFYLPECYERAGMPRRARIALVLPGGQAPLGAPGLYDFLETVCQNRGYLCRLFDCQETADLWLQGMAAATMRVQQ
jgi:hypothetical protein